MNEILWVPRATDIAGNELVLDQYLSFIKRIAKSNILRFVLRTVREVVRPASLLGAYVLGAERAHYCCARLYGRQEEIRLINIYGKKPRQVVRKM